MYKLIALDLDGTLTDKNKNILEETKQELIKLAQKGIIIVLASGRPTAGIFKEAKELTLDQVGGYLLSFNGARVLDYKTNEVVYEQTLSSEIAHEMYDRAKAFSQRGSAELADDPQAEMEDRFACHVLGACGDRVCHSGVCGFRLHCCNLCGTFFQAEPVYGDPPFRGWPAGDRNHLSGFDFCNCGGVCGTFRGLLSVWKPPVPHRTMGLWLSGKGKHKPQNTGDCPDRGSLCRNVLYL